MPTELPLFQAVYSKRIAVSPGRAFLCDAVEIVNFPLTIAGAPSFWDVRPSCGQESRLSHPRTLAMGFRRALATTSIAFLLAGLAAAYLSAVIGLTGYINVRTVSLIVICGASVAFVSAVVYFAGRELELRRGRNTG